jgi:hypothetical protein
MVKEQVPVARTDNFNPGSTKHLVPVVLVIDSANPESAEKNDVKFGFGIPTYSFGNNPDLS